MKIRFPHFLGDRAKLFGWIPVQWLVSWVIGAVIAMFGFFTLALIVVLIYCGGDWAWEKVAGSGIPTRKIAAKLGFTMVDHTRVNPYEKKWRW